MEGFITRDGMCAIQHHNTNGCTVKMEVDGTVYTFVPKHNVSMAWIQEKHVPAIMSQLARMCCGKMQRKFHPASQINVNLWEYGTRHGATEENA